MKISHLITTVISFVLLIAFAYALYLSHDPLGRPLQTEWIENTFPQKIDEESALWNILPYGYTLGAWPKYFHSEPIVTKMTYQKGPPQKFIERMIQVWKPIEVELTLLGPKTIDPHLSQLEWKACVQSRHSCLNQKKKLNQYAYQDLLKLKHETLVASWFDSLDPLAARGIHIHFEADTYFIDRFIPITEKGVAQVFSLKYVKNPVGLEAKDLFYQIIGSLKLNDHLDHSRIWIQNKIKSVNLNEIRKITDPKLRFLKLIQVQNWIFSLLSVDPSQSTPFYHLAGVTHLLSMDLLKQETQFYENQESWILQAKPLLETLIAYGKDFESMDPKNKELVTNMESLLQDILLLQQNISTGSKK